ncbi:glutamate carrier 1 domain protein [Dictyocaulus viviparus]|uniref:Glutamate carrier 1 domain protein n=1 Tax=Dictyocaulus viviparus TaxID=29172 RepID=A0A0D8XF78_DICVI|nr:glutamate carrier 1 domain protein [Dictyocaulus viviparus]
MKFHTFRLDCATKTWRSGGDSLFSKVDKLNTTCSSIYLLRLLIRVFGTLSAWRGMIAGGLAGMFQIVVTTPMELLKIQMQDQGRITVSGQKKTTALELTIGLLRDRGIAGLYKGLGPTFARDVTFSIMYFPLFAYLDSLGPRKNDGSGDAVFWTSFLAGLTSGAFSSFAVTPLDVIKTRMQTINKGLNEVVYKNVLDAFVRIFNMEGPRAFFKGAACRMMVMAPLFGIAQTVYYVGVAEKILGMEKTMHV